MDEELTPHSLVHQYYRNLPKLIKNTKNNYYKAKVNVDKYITKNLWKTGKMRT